LFWQNNANSDEFFTYCSLLNLITCYLLNSQGCTNPKICFRRQAYKYVEHFLTSTPTLPAAVSLCKLLSSLAAMGGEEAIERKTGE
jgi:hypothetical protein